MTRLLMAEPFKTTGGQERFAIDLTEAMAARGFDTAILAEPANAMESALARVTIPVYRCPQGGPRGWWRGLRETRNRFRPHVVVFNGDRAGFWGRMERAIRPAWTRALGPRTEREAHDGSSVWIAHLHIDDIMTEWPPTKRLLYRAAYRATLPFCDHIVAVSEHIRTRLVDRDGVDRRKITVIRNWASPPPVVRPPAEIRRQHRVSADGPIVGAVSRLDRQKGLEGLLEAWRMLPRGTATLLILGEGPLEAALRSRVAALGLENEVRLCGFQEDVGSFLALFDAFVLPSRYEGFPLALLEAMGHALPVVASDVPGVRDVIEHGRQGLLVPPESPPALAATLSRLLEDPSLRKRLGEAARRRVEIEFAPGSVHDAYEHLFRSLASGAPEGAKHA
jgi:glycosyltransferase involved in cell wall biosynthesis